MNALHNKDKEAKAFQEALYISRDSTKHYINRYGETVATSQVMELKLSQLRNNYDELGISKKQLEAQVGGLNKLVSYYRGIMFTTNTFNTKGKDSIIYVHDSQKDSIRYDFKNFNFATKYLSFVGHYNINTDTLHAIYTYSSPILITVDNKYIGLFKPRKLEAKASFEDPAAKITSQQMLVITKPKKWYETNAAKIGFGVLLGIVIEKELK